MTLARLAGDRLGDDRAEPGRVENFGQLRHVPARSACGHHGVAQRHPRQIDRHIYHGQGRCITSNGLSSQLVKSQRVTIII